MHSKGAAVLALQETRQVAPPLSVVDGTIRLASAPLEGQLGCQLWLRPVGPLTFDRHKLSIACSEPRLLLLCLPTQRFAALPSLLHMPQHRLLPPPSAKLGGITLRLASPVCHRPQCLFFAAMLMPDSNCRPARKIRPMQMPYDCKG